MQNVDFKKLIYCILDDFFQLITHKCYCFSSRHFTIMNAASVYFTSSRAMVVTDTVLKVVIYDMIGYFL